MVGGAYSYSGYINSLLIFDYIIHSFAYNEKFIISRPVCVCVSGCSIKR